MQVKKISALCALAFAGFSGSSFAAMSAAEVAIVNDANNNSRVIFISGASAVQKGFGGIIAKTFTGTPIRFANTTASSKDYEAVAGKLAVAAGGWAANSNVIIVYRVKGGSVFGVDPVARATSIESLAVTSACGATGAGTAASPYVCGLTTAVPDAGVSDVAPGLFKFGGNTEGETAAAELSPEELALLTPTPIYGLAFGVPVTSNVPMINLNKAAVSAIMTGNVGDWSQVDAAASGDIVICRRVPGSGTQAVDNMYFGGFACGSNVNIPADRDASGAWDRNQAFSGFDHDANPATPALSGVGQFTAANGAGGLIVIENSTSGDVRTCLDKAVTGGAYATKDRDGNNVKVDFGAGGYKAIGVLSMDSLANSTAAGNWQFRSLDGAGKITQASATALPVESGTGKLPSKANLVNGSWDLVGMVSFNMPARTTGNKAAVLANFLANAQSPSVLYSLDALRYVAGSAAGTADESVTKTAADGGAVGLSGNVMRASFLGGDQCAPYNRNN